MELKTPLLIRGHQKYLVQQNDVFERYLSTIFTPFDHINIDNGFGQQFFTYMKRFRLLKVITCQKLRRRCVDAKYRT